MKKLLIASLLSLAACGKASGPSASTSPASPVAAPTPAPGLVVSPTPTPAPVRDPLALICYLGAGVYCNGGNVGTLTIHLNASMMFGSGVTITITSVSNNMDGSVCVFADVNNGGGTFHELQCGNAADPGTAYRTLVTL